ncbi:MAG: DUF2796 domain-containing protein [Bdellovibrio sp.]|jgi:hypothetical protein
MKTKILTLVVIGVLAASICSAKPKRSGHVHTHGEVNVDIGAEGNKASVSFSIDTHSLLGFERPAKTAKEKAAVEQVYKTFRSEIGQLFAFDPKLNCKFEERKLLIGPEGKHEAAESHAHDHVKGGHQSLFGDFNITCASQVAPSKVRVDLKSRFSGIRKIKVKVLTEAGADSAELPGSGEVNLK